MLPDNFQTAHLLFRPVEASDAWPIFDSYAQDPEVSRYLTWRPHTDLGQTKAYVQACLNASDYRTYVLLQRATGKVIGSFDLRETGPARMGYGYVLARRFWGKGLMTEALTQVVDWALCQPSFWRIGDVVDTANLGSARDGEGGLGA